MGNATVWIIGPFSQPEIGANSEYLIDDTKQYAHESDQKSNSFGINPIYFPFDFFGFQSFALDEISTTTYEV